MKESNIWKRFFRWLVGDRKESTAQHENEVETNLKGSTALLACLAIAVFYVIMCLTDVLSIDDTKALIMLLIAAPCSLIPWWLCRLFKGEGRVLKYLLIGAFIIMCCMVQLLLDLRSTIISVMPMIVSCWYLSRVLTRNTCLINMVTALAVEIIEPESHLNKISTAMSGVPVPNSRIGGLMTVSTSVVTRDLTGEVTNLIMKTAIFVVVGAFLYKVAARGERMLRMENEYARAKSRTRTEMDMARTLQQSVLPKPGDLPPHPEFAIASCSDPAKSVGGDFFDYYYVDRNHLALLIADVADKGMAASLYMMISKTLLASTGKRGHSPAEVLTEVNHTLCEKQLQAMFVTVWLGVLNLETGEVICANAGHEAPVLRRKGGSFEQLSGTHGLVLGAMGGIRYHESSFTMSPGDTLFLHTDGVTDARNATGEMFGAGRMLETLNGHAEEPPEAMLNSIRLDIAEFSGDTAQYDDMTMVIFRLKELKPAEGVTLVPDRRGLEAAVGYVDGVLEESGMPALYANRMRIAMDEMYTNIVSYSGAAWSQVICRADSAGAELILRDNGTAYDPLQREDPDVTLPAEQRHEGGLGIFMTKKLMTEISYSYSYNTNEMRLTLRVPESA